MTKKMIGCLLPVLFLAACSNSSDSKSDSPAKGKSEKLTPEISAEVNSFATRVTDFNLMVAQSTSGDNSVGEGAPDDVKASCKLSTARNLTTADSISFDKIQLGGDNCPVEVYKEFRFPPVGGNVKWVNSYDVKSAEYQKNYGFKSIVERNEISNKMDPGEYQFKQQLEITLADGSLAVWSVSTLDKYTETENVYSYSSRLLYKGDTIRAEVKSVSNPNASAGTNTPTADLKFYFNDKEISKDEYDKTGMDRMYMLY